MKIITLLSIFLLSTYAYDTFWQKGESLLQELQNGKDEIFVITFYNPTPVKDDYSRQMMNNQVQDQLQSTVLNKYDSKPLKIRYSSIDTTDRDNEILMYKAGVKQSNLLNGPVVLITRKGRGNSVWGPTIIEKVEDFVKNIQENAEKDQKSE